ncbi:MAG: HAD family hydrolase [Patescibacteria group bacterium]|nr:HAD family hydrolase [Patescibacteria group bacterium]
MGIRHNFPTGLNRAVFLDRDGVINPTVGFDEFGRTESPLRLEDYQIFPWTAEAVKILNDLGFHVFVVTNQPAVAKGKLDLFDLDGMHAFLIRQVRQKDGVIDKVYVCLHHPDPNQVRDKTLLADCDCRKPKHGMLLQATREFNIDLTRSWMIGDTWKDIQAGQAVGCRTILVRNEIDNRGKTINPDFSAENLLEATHIIEREETSK